MRRTCSTAVHVPCAEATRSIISDVGARVCPLASYTFTGDTPKRVSFGGFTQYFRRSEIFAAFVLGTGRGILCPVVLFVPL